MATLNAIARPYAKAAYEYAQAKNELPLWGKLLKDAATVVQDPVVSKALSNSRVSPHQWFSFLSDVLSKELNEERKNFLRLVAENKRLAALPDILEQFKEYEARDNKVTEVEVTTAIPLDKNYQQKLISKLTETLKHQVSLRCEVDENILGGAMIRAGDRVIDGSVRGQLTRLLEFAIR